MGLFVVVSDGNPDAPGFADADECLLVSTYDVEATVKTARAFNDARRPINGVVSVAADVPQTVSAVAKELNLPGISASAAFLAADKLAMKRQFQEDGIPIPWFSAVESVGHLRELVSERGFPLVLKPVDSRGARGVLRLRPDVSLDWAYSISLEESPTGRVMVEEFLPGPQLSTESVVMGGKGYTVAFSDPNYELLDKYAPFIIENGGQMPSSLPASVQIAAAQVIESAAASLGITDGVVKGDVVVTEGRPYIFEFAARLSGGYFCTHQIPLSTGVDLVGAAFDLSLGNRIDPERLVPTKEQHVAQRYFFPGPGRISSVTVPPEFLGNDSIPFLEMRLEVGDVIGSFVSHPSRAGVVITTGPTRAAAVGLARDVAENIRIETVEA